MKSTCIILLEITLHANNGHSYLCKEPTFRQWCLCNMTPSIWTMGSDVDRICPKPILISLRTTSAKIQPQLAGVFQLREDVTALQEKSDAIAVLLFWNFLSYAQWRNTLTNQEESLVIYSTITSFGQINCSKNQSFLKKHFKIRPLEIFTFKIIGVVQRFRYPGKEHSFAVLLRLPSRSFP